MARNVVRFSIALSSVLLMASCSLIVGVDDDLVKDDGDKLNNGTACNTGTDCQSGICSGGVCCDSDC